VHGCYFDGVSITGKPKRSRPGTKPRSATSKVPTPAPKPRPVRGASAASKIADKKVKFAGVEIRQASTSRSIALDSESDDSTKLVPWPKRPRKGKGKARDTGSLEDEASAIRAQILKDEAKVLALEGGVKALKERLVEIEDELAE